MRKGFWIAAPACGLAALAPFARAAGETGGRADQLGTRWSAEARAGVGRTSYPRPSLVREEWLSLDGEWQYAIAPREASGMPPVWEGTIRVPFAIEWPLSGVARALSPKERLWYRRHIELPTAWEGRRVLLNLEAVDWEAEVFVDGVSVGVHRGGYDRATFDLTDALGGRREAELTVAVWDPTDSGGQPRGKQVRKPGGIWYTATSGIWGSAWLEPVGHAWIERLQVIPDAAAGELLLGASLGRGAGGCILEVCARAGGEVVAQGRGRVSQGVLLRFERPHLWSPEDPFLYDLEVRLLATAGGGEFDRVHTRVGLRDVAVDVGDDGVPRFFLNGEPRFLLGMLDQGYWPDGGLTAPTEAALRHDIALARRMGFSCLRKHVTVAPDRWYALCDELGMLVIQDMPNGDNGTEAARQGFRRELREIVQEHASHPSIVMWVPFNEGWGQHDDEAIVEFVRSLDPTRPIDAASGWVDHGLGEVADVHAYPGPAIPANDGRRALLLGEFGGLGYRVDGHLWGGGGWGYVEYADAEELARRYEELLAEVHRLREEEGLSGAIYTQLSDVESELNGLVSYDRAVEKIPVARVRRANLGYLPPRLASRSELFVGASEVVLAAARAGALIRYTLDGLDPGEGSPLYTGPVRVETTSELRARAFWPDGERSSVARWHLVRATPRPSIPLGAIAGRPTGLELAVYEGRFERLPDFAVLEPLERRTASAVDLSGLERRENFALVFEGFLVVPATGVWRFTLASDDGSRLLLDDTLVVDNDGVHGLRQVEGAIALEAGAHRLRVEFFQGMGGIALSAAIEGPGLARRPIGGELVRR